MASLSARAAGLRSLLDRVTTPGGLFVTAVLGVAALPVTNVIRDPDFWWHLRAGQLILQRHSLVGTDPFTYTVATHHWTMHEWLTEVGFALMHQVGGLGLIVLALSALTWAGILCIFLRARLRRPPMFVLGVGLLIGVVAGYPIWGPRAQMITFTLSCLLLLIIERHLHRGGRIAWLLVPMFVVWSNLHSGFIMGLGFIAVVLVAEVVGATLGLPDAAPRERVRTLGLVLLACTAASMVNPNGPGILLYAFQTQGSAAQQSLIAEWHSPDFHDWEVKAFELMLLTLVAMVVTNRRLRARDAALLLVTTALALQSVRHIALFVAAATPMWIDQANLLVRRVRARPRRARPLPPLTVRTVAYAAVVSVVAALYLASRLAPSVATTEASSRYATDFPVCAAQWLASSSRPLRIFNQYGEGGYLAYALSSRGDRVYVFGDAALMGDALLYQYADVESVQPDWDVIIQRSGADIVLFDRDTPLANVMARSADWMKVYEDRLNVAFVPAAKHAELHLPPASAAFTRSPTCAAHASTAVAAAPGGPGG